MIKLGFGYAKDAVKFILCLFAPSNITNTFHAIRGMSLRDLIVGFFRLNFHLAYTLVMFIFTIFWYVVWNNLLLVCLPLIAALKPQSNGPSDVLRSLISALVVCLKVLVLRLSLQWCGQCHYIKGPFIATQLNSTSSWVELRRRSVYSDADATQLNSNWTQLDVELSWVASL